MYLSGCCYLGLMLHLNIWGHIMTLPACSSGILTIVLPRWNAMPQTQDLPPHPVTVYRHRTCHPIPSQYTDTGHATHTLPPSQYTDTGHATPPRHSIQTQDMPPHPVTVYRHRTCHPIPSQYTDTGHATHTLPPSQYTDTGHATPPRHSIQTQDMPPHPVTVYRHRTCHPIPSQYTDTGLTCCCTKHWCGMLPTTCFNVLYVSEKPFPQPSTCKANIVRQYYYGGIQLEAC